METKKKELEKEINKILEMFNDGLITESQMAARIASECLTFIEGGY